MPIFKKDQVVVKADPIIEDKFQAIMNEAIKMVDLTKDLRNRIQNSKDETSSIVDAKRGSNAYER